MAENVQSNDSAQPLLSVSNLAVKFRTYRGTVNAVRNVNFTLGRGEALGIVGESGCGKSVTAHAIMQLLPEENSFIEEGATIVMEGQNLLTLSAKEMRKVRGGEIGMIFQDPMTSLNPVLTIGHQLTETLRLHKSMTKQEAEAKAVEMLGLVGIPFPEKRLKDYPHQFSGGMRQRVMIAMALACNPKVIICDEPISALDVSIQAQVVNLLSRLQKELGLTYLFIAHDLAMVRYISQRVAVMYLGKIVEVAATEELYNHPFHPYTQALLSAIPVPDPDDQQQRIHLDGELPSPINPPAGCHFCTRCPYATDKCRTEEPAMQTFGDRQCACHYVDADGFHGKAVQH